MAHVRHVTDATCACIAAHYHLRTYRFNSRVYARDTARCGVGGEDSASATTTSRPTHITAFRLGSGRIPPREQQGQREHGRPKALPAG